MKSQVLKILIITFSLLVASTIAGAKEYPYPERVYSSELKALFQPTFQYKEKKEYQKVIEELERIIKEHPDDSFIQVQSYAFLGHTYFAYLKDTEQALKNFKLSLEKCPPGDKDCDRYRIEAYYFIATCLRRLGEYDETIEVAQKLIAEYPDDSTFADDAPGFISWSFKKKGEIHTGIRVLEKLTKKYPDTDVERTALFNLAFFYKDLEDYSNAAAYYQKLINKFPDTKMASIGEDVIKDLREEGKITGRIGPPKPERRLAKVFTRSPLVRLIGIPLVALAVLIYLSILIVRWRKKK